MSGDSPLPTPKEGETVLVDIERGTRNVLRVSYLAYRGHPYVSIWTWWYALERGWLPTRRGATVRLSELDDVIAALEVVRSHIEAEEGQP